MSSAKHTDGQWTLQPEFSQDHGQFSVTGPDGEEIAAVAAWLGEHRSEAEANARLIAAAPDLLCVAEMCAELGERWGEQGPLVQSARAAIAKAEGRK